MRLLLLWLELCTSKIKLNRIDCHGDDGSHGNTNMMCEYIWSPKYRNGVFSVQSNTYSIIFIIAIVLGKHMLAFLF